MESIEEEARPPWRYALIALITFVVALLSHSAVRAIDPWWSWVQTLPDALRYLEESLRNTLICLAGLWVAHRTPPRKMAAALGMRGSLPTALAVTFIACSPMLFVPALLTLVGEFRLDPEFSLLRHLIFGAIIWPLGEEILFRGYTFRQLYRHGGFGFWTAAIAIGAIFGLLHLGQQSVQQLPFSGAIGAILIVSLGGILFAWLFVRWEDNLWVPWGAHLFMNLWWSVFAMADSPLGGWLPNVLRLLSVILLVVITLKREAIMRRISERTRRAP